MASALDRAIGEVGERWQRARRAVEGVAAHSPFADDEHGFRMTDVFAVVQDAIAWLGDVFGEHHLPIVRTPGILLLRTASGVIAVVDDSLDGPTMRRETAAVIPLLREADERLQCTAELLALLAGLATRWVASGFAPPVVLSSLRRSGPRILELGRSLAAA
jgi:hypothetical protein